MIPKDAKICPHCRKKLGWPLLARIAVTICLFFGIVFGMSVINGYRMMADIQSPKGEALSAVKLKYEWSKEGFGNVMEASFTIDNQSTYDIKDIEITCNHMAKSGTVIDSNKRTIYDIVKANSKKKVNYHRPCRWLLIKTTTPDNVIRCRPSTS